MRLSAVLFPVGARRVEAWRLWTALAWAFLVLPAGWSQPANPRIGYVYPAGGQRGATFRVVVGGQFLGGITNVHSSGAGLQARVVDYTRPLTQKEFNDLREKLKELQDRRAASGRSDRPREGGAAAGAGTNDWTAADDATLAEVRKKLANPPNRQANPAISETVTLEVTVAPDAPPGSRELRLGTGATLSNPLVFLVGALPEVAEEPAKSGPDPSRPREARLAERPAVAAKPETRLALPAVVNGQIMPGTVDRYRFTAPKGTRLVAVLAARALIPYLPDAVPGWFQATLALRDAKGKEVAYVDDFTFHPDPAFACELPADGEYVLEVKDAIYRGREDFVYRLTVGEVPFITSIFPLGGPAGRGTAIELRGWHLPVTNLTVEAASLEAGVQGVSVRTGAQESNLVPFAVDSLPECFEREGNDGMPEARPLSLPTIVDGRVERPGDTDWFRFEGRAGQPVVAEVYARRLESPLDSTLKLSDATGRQLAFNDDCEDKGAGLLTHHADSRLSAVLPADGTYYVQLADAQGHGGPDAGYRLRLSAPRPDFELRVVPSTVNARGGASVLVTVYAFRKDGFAGPIELALRGAPAGFSLSGARVPANQEQVRLTLYIPPTTGTEPVALEFEGRASVDGQDRVRRALPAEDMMQAFAYRHLVPAREFLVAVAGRAPVGGGLRILNPTPIRIPAGGTARVRIGTPARALPDRVRLELSEPPDGISLQQVAASRDGTELVVACDAAKATPGLAGNLIVGAYGSRAGGGAGPGQAARRGPGVFLPAIPFEVVAQ